MFERLDIYIEIDREIAERIKKKGKGQAFGVFRVVGIRVCGCLTRENSIRFFSLDGFSRVINCVVACGNKDTLGEEESEQPSSTSARLPTSDESDIATPIG